MRLPEQQRHTQRLQNMARKERRAAHDRTVHRRDSKNLNNPFHGLTSYLSSTLALHQIVDRGESMSGNEPTRLTLLNLDPDSA